MITPAAVLAVIRASKPNFRSKFDRVAFSLHAVLSVNGLRLVGVGPSADLSGPHPLPHLLSGEADVDGWNAQDGEYTFLYAADDDTDSTHGQQRQGQQQGQQQAKKRLLLVKALVMGDLLLVSMVTAVAAAPAAAAAPPAPAAAPAESGAPASSAAASVATTGNPVTVDLDCDHYASDDAPDVASGYKDVTGLLKAVQGGLEQVMPPGQPPPSAAEIPPRVPCSLAAGAPPAGGGSGSRPYGGGGDADDGYDPLRVPSRVRGPGGVRGPLGGPDYEYLPAPGRNPLSVGEGDAFGGVPRPGFGAGVGMGPINPLTGGGGMQVGPGHPMFADRVRQPPPGMGPGHGLPQGARWDPIAPEGLQGWRPDDFVRPGQGGRGSGGRGADVHPDIMQPGAGRGTDWDAMFG